MRTLLPAVAATLVLSACPPAVTRCTRDSQCSADQLCAPGGICTGKCSPACNADETCDEGKCYAKDCGAAPCDDNAFCFGGVCVFHGCRNKTCGANRVCANGGVCVDQNCKDTACGEGLVCVGGETCGEPACVGVTCGKDQRCYQGGCRDKDCGGRSCGTSFCADGTHCKDCKDRVCGRDEVCIANACQAAVCAERPESELCLNACREAGTPCAASQICIGERCAERDCPHQSCPPGTYCGGERCVPAACAGVVCPAEAQCSADGACRPTACGGAPCPDGFVCESGRCLSAVCAGVVCGDEAECLGGTCYPKEKPDGTACPEGQLWIAEACRDGYSQGCPAPCARGFTCAEGTCVSAACQGVVCADGLECYGGACYPAGTAPSYPPGGGPIPCGATTCADGWSCVADTCVSPACLGVSCGALQACWGGACAPTQDGDGNACPGGSAFVQGACRPTSELEPCLGAVCQEGWYCDQGRCVSACAPVVCTETQGCYAGRCLERGSCPAGQVPVGGACRDEGPPPGCSAVLCEVGQLCLSGECLPTDGCPGGQVLQEGACVPADPVQAPCPTLVCNGTCCVDNCTCLGGACTPLTGECLAGQCIACGATSCAPGTSCSNGECLGACEQCGPDYACENRDAPPCKPLGCLGITCPAGEHCVPGASPLQGLCQPDACPPDDDDERQVFCMPWEKCVDGACVESLCTTVVCEAGERCLLGQCLPACCPNSDCSEQTVCLGEQTFYTQCPSHDCSEGQVCFGDMCSSNSAGCTAAAEPLACNGLDEDCTGSADDATFFGYSVWPIPSSETIASPNPKHPGDLVRMPWGRCDVTDPLDFDCVKRFSDGRNIYLQQGDRLPVATPGTPTWKDGGTVHKMSSCVYLAMPYDGSCNVFHAQKVTLDLHGSQVVPGSQELECVGTNCMQSYVDVFWLDARDFQYKRLCSKKLASDRDVRLTCRPPGIPTANLRGLMVCRRLPPADLIATHEFQHVGIEGISLSGCCSSR